MYKLDKPWDEFWNSFIGDHQQGIAIIAIIALIGLIAIFTRVLETRTFLKIISIVGLISFPILCYLFFNN